VRKFVMSSSEESDVRRIRLARNQTLFREVNERVNRVANGFGADAPISFVCECSNTDCAKQIELSTDEYERLRSVPTWFAVAPGHEVLEIENIVEVNERYATVEKVAVGGMIAAATYPRRAP
jgi:hypothetical protein